jgi:sugar lactone lactonase YvrE
MLKSLDAPRSMLGECPRWHQGESALYWLDIYGQRLHRWEPATGVRATTDLDDMVSAFAFMRGGGYVLATRRGFALADSLLRITRRLDPLVAEDSDIRFNDGAADPAGRFWAGTMNPRREPENYLYRLDLDGRAHAMESDISVSNGIGWSPDNRIMYYVDTPTRCIFAYDYDVTSGTISHRRVWVQTPEQPGTPDGITVDREGGVWCAYWDGWRVVRYDPDGKAVETVKIPVARPTACTFGGPDMRTLYITTARVGIGTDMLGQQSDAGALFAYQTSTVGLPPFEFAGLTDSHG